ncbi:MAG TPA: hypothetical protein VLM75_08720 [Spirochaetota bacterium]|nr:hypothetical protein [Spirochaetota bacterium]
MKNTARNVFTIALIILATATSPLFAESVFLKDGSIVEGTVTTETSESLTITTPNKLKTEIPRTEILRVLTDNDYKKPSTIRKKDGTEITAHVVEERTDAFIVRMTLSSPNEIAISKQDIHEFVGKQPTVTIKTSGPRVYTPKEAAQTSIIPIRSGSLLVKKDYLGITLVFAKTGALVFPLALIGGGAMGSMGSDGSTGSSSSSSNSLEDETTKKIVFISFGAWVLLTATDMIYSYYRVKSFNERAASETKAGASFGFSVMPLVCSGTPEPGERRACGRVEGVAAMAVMRF